MNEQKNLFSAIAISIAIIVFFQFFFATPITEPIQKSENEILAPAASIDSNKTNVIEIIKDFDLPTSASSRKNAIRKNKATKMVTEKVGQAVLNEMREFMLKTVNKLDQLKRRDYIMKSWIDANDELYPPYVKVTGRGTKTPFTADIEDPLNNPKLKALMEKKIMFEKVGNESIGVKAGNKKILKMSLEWRSLTA